VGVCLFAGKTLIENQANAGNVYNLKKEFNGKACFRLLCIKRTANKPVMGTASLVERHR